MGILIITIGITGTAILTMVDTIITQEVTLEGTKYLKARETLAAPAATPEVIGELVPRATRLMYHRLQFQQEHRAPPQRQEPRAAVEALKALVLQKDGADREGAQGLRQLKAAGPMAKSVEGRDALVDAMGDHVGAIKRMSAGTSSPLQVLPSHQHLHDLEARWMEIVLKILDGQISLEDKSVTLRRLRNPFQALHLHGVATTQVAATVVVVAVDEVKAVEAEAGEAQEAQDNRAVGNQL